MRTSIVILAVALATAACSNPAKDKPMATVGNETTGSTQSPTGKIESLALSPGASTVTFVGSKITGSHTGTFGQFNGTIQLSDGSPKNGKVRVDIDMASVKTDAEKLDGHLKSPDFFDVAKYPKAVFETTEIRQGGDNGASHTLVGNLSLHGVTKSISFPANIQVSGDSVSATSEFVIKRKDFGIVYPGKPDDLIRDEVVIKLSLKVPRVRS